MQICMNSIVKGKVKYDSNALKHDMVKVCHANTLETFFSSFPAWLACWLAGQDRVGWPGLCLSNTIHTLLGRRGWEKMNLLSWLGEWQEYKKRWNTQKHDTFPQGHRLIRRGMLGWSGKLSCFCVMLRTGVMLRLWKKQRMSCFYPKGKSALFIRWPRFFARPATARPLRASPLCITCGVLMLEWEKLLLYIGWNIGAFPCLHNAPTT